MIIWGDGVVVSVEVRGTSVYIEAQRFPALVPTRADIGVIWPPLNDTQIRKAREARGLGLRVEVPEPIDHPAAFETLAQLLEFCNGLEQEFDGTFIRFKDIDLDDFPTGSIRQEESSCHDIHAFVAETGNEHEVSLWAGENQPLSWDDAKEHLNPEVIAFIEGLRAAAKAAWQVRASEQAAARRRQLATEYGLDEERES